eukprot:g4203.t1
MLSGNSKRNFPHGSAVPRSVQEMAEFLSPQVDDDGVEQAEFLRLSVRVVQDGRDVTTLIVSLGRATQTVQWLGATVAQRLSLREAPRGARRSVERRRIRGGFLLPRAVFLVKCGSSVRRPLQPEEQLCNVFASSDSAVVELNGQYAPSWRPYLRTNSRGAPVRSSFHQAAYHRSRGGQLPQQRHVFADDIPRSAHRRPSEARLPPRPSSASCGRSPVRGPGALLRPRAVGQSAADNVNTRTWQAFSARPTSASWVAGARNRFVVSGAVTAMGGSSAKSEARRQRNAAQFKANMSKQMAYHNVFGLSTEAERLEEVRMVVREDLRKIEYETVFAHEPDVRRHVEEVLVQHFPLLNSMFRHYCGFGNTPDIAMSLETLSFVELVKLLTHAGFFDMQRAFAALGTVYRDSQLSRHELAGGSAATLVEQDIDHIEFRRHDFIESLVRLAESKADYRLPAGEALHKMLGSLQVPRILQLLETPLHEGLRAATVQAMLQKNFSMLRTVYRHYAVIGSGGRSRPTMDIHEFNELLKDAGLLDTRLGALAPERSMLRADGSIDTPGGKANFTTHHALVAFTAAQSEPLAASGGAVGDVSDGGATDADYDALLAGHDSDSELVFAEFVEAVCRVAIMKWRTAQMSFSQKLSLALDALRDVGRLIKNQDAKLLKKSLKKGAGGGASASRK